MSHSCQNLIIRCMDFRLEEPIEKWLKEKGYLGDTDVVSVAGSCKIVAANHENCDGAYILSHVELAKRLHGIKRVFLTQHEDCGAYGGRSAFENDEAQKLKLVSDMKKVKSIIKERFSDLEIKMFLIKQTGEFWELAEIAD